MGYGFLLFKASFFIVEQMLQQVVFPFTKTDSDMVHGAAQSNYNELVHLENNYLRPPH